MKFISVFNQPINVEKFVGKEQFLYNSQEFRDEYNRDTTNVNVKAIQLNQGAFDFYKLKVADGRTFDWEKVDYDSNRLPVYKIDNSLKP